MNLPKYSTRIAGLALLAFTGVVGWQQLRRWSIPANRRTINVTDVPGTPHLLTDKILKARPPVQLLRDGVGPLFHRRYYADIQKPRLSKKGLIQAIVDDINYCCPTEMANFEKGPIYNHKETI